MKYAPFNHHRNVENNDFRVLARFIILEITTRFKIQNNKPY